LADVVEVKTGSRSTAHWRIHFIRPNGWLRHSFAQLITLLDIDGIGQNWEGSNTWDREADLTIETKIAATTTASAVGTRASLSQPTGGSRLIGARGVPDCLPLQTSRSDR